LIKCEKKSDDLLFDTRYFWTIFTEKDSESIGRLKVIFERSKKRLVSSITIYEVHKLTLESDGEDVAELRINTIKRDFDVIDVNSSIAEEGARIAHVQRSPMADCLIMATAREMKVPCVTDDPHFNYIKTVWI
jgi:predicted nucleic acid-binding protein